MRLPSPSLLFVFAIPIGGSPKDLSIASAGFTVSSPIASIGIFWRKFVTSLAVRQTTKVMVHSFRECRLSHVIRVQQHLQMFRPAARLHFAQMMNFQSSWNWPNKQLVNMSVNIFPFSVNQYNSIVSGSSSAGPEPAAGISFNTDPFLHT